MLTGALFDKHSFARGAFARRPFFDAFVAESLQAAFERFAARTGRHYQSLSRYRTKDAKLLLLAQGAAVETARAAADNLRKHHKIRTGVLGVHALRPFPADEIAAELRGIESWHALLGSRLERRVHEIVDDARDALGEAVDREDRQITGSFLNWQSSLDGRIDREGLLNR